MSNFALFLLQKITAVILFFISIFNCLFGLNKIDEKTDLVNGSLVGTDALGRSFVTAADSEKKVGVFYFLWHGQHGRERIINNTELVAANPDAVKSQEAWMAAGGGVINEFHFWGEPLLGYYTADDSWVYRKHLQMLTDAKVDFIVIDITNSFTYSEPAKLLIDVWYEYLLDGWNVPKIAFYTNSSSGNTMNRIYDEVYNDPELNQKYPNLEELWFKLDGKPMIVGDENDPALREDVKSYFRIKANQWPNEDKKKDGFPWMEFDRSLTLQAMYDSQGTKIMNVSVAQHSNTTAFSKTAWYGANDRTRSWHDGKNDTSDDAMLYGYNFAEQWEFAIKMDPDIIFVTGFNEWVAQRQPGTQDAPVLFIDCADENSSRDVEPSAGILGDNYYLQMVNYIAEFKKSVSKVSQGEFIKIDIDGGFEQWNNRKISAVYKDYNNDTAPRNAQGYGGVVYTDTSGRNDIVNMKVAQDVQSVYFYVDTADELTSSQDKNWMSLFIGNDYVINRTSPENGKTDIERITDHGFEKCAEAQIRFENNKLMLKVSKADISFSGSIQFKWADNYNENDVYSFYTMGDCAPYGRMYYSF
ncbi:MAG: hypothetical protein IJZ57_11600 [Clostridia bacterium]|nr:hypothetical protein [Clostridia bacterium]